MPPVIDKNTCDGCGICEKICPGDILAMEDEPLLALVAYPEECWHCGACSLDCPEESITIHIPLAMMLATAKPGSTLE